MSTTRAVSNGHINCFIACPIIIVAAVFADLRILGFITGFIAYTGESSATVVVPARPLQERVLMQLPHAI